MRSLLQFAHFANLEVRSFPGLLRVITLYPLDVQRNKKSGMFNMAYRVTILLKRGNIKTDLAIHSSHK